MRRMFSEKELKEKAGAVAQELIESGQVENAKPIYCHPIYLFLNSAEVKTDLTMLIFNDNPEEMTLDDLKEFMDNIAAENESGVQILVSGYYIGSSNLDSTSYIYKGYASGNYGIVGWDAQNRTRSVLGSTTFNDIFPSTIQVIDHVNKIN